MHLIGLYCLGVLGTFFMMWRFRNYGYNNPFILIQSVAFFLFFTKFTFENKFVNFIASSSLMVFLLHRHPVIRDYWASILFYLKRQYGDSLQFVLILCLFCIIVFIVAVLYDQLRKSSWKLIEPFIKQWDQKVSF